MFKTHHGKHYYIECKVPEVLIKVVNFLNQLKEFEDETFSVDFDNLLIISVAEVPAFRGNKYAAWEKTKRYAQKLKRELRA